MTITPALFIRRHVFGFDSQQPFADLLKTSQVTISRWEQGQDIPPSKQGQIRTLAKERGHEWNDSWFFDVPAEYQDTKITIETAQA
jgi:hypothetical protein